MSNVSQRIGQSQSLQYSRSQSHNNLRLNHERLTDSLQYLDRIRSINKKVFDSTSNKDSAMVSPLQKLVHSDKQITYIDNQKLYGIIKIQNLTKLKARVEQLEVEYEKYKQVQHQLRIRNIYLDKELSRLRGRESQLTQTVQQIQQTLKREESFRSAAEQKAKSIQDSFFTLSNQRLQDSSRYLALNSDFQQLKTEIQERKSITHAQLMVCEAQTQFIKPTIQISSFEPNIEEILKKIRQKEGEKISRPTLKEIVSQSLDAFVKDLDSQYKLIHEQTIDLNNLRQKNQSLIEQNSALKKKLQEIEIEEEKLKIFKSCMTEFLQDTSQNVSKSIQGERIRQRIYDQLSEEQRNIISQGLQLIQGQAEGEQQRIQVRQVRQMRENMEYLKRENLSLVKTIGEYQYKWRNVQKVLDQNKKEQIPDDGTIGQLVKMSKLVKESIKNLLHQL